MYRQHSDQDTGKVIVHTYYVEEEKLEEHQRVQRRADKTEQTESRKKFLLDSPYCKIPDIDPFDPIAAGQVNRQGQLRCKGQRSITYVDGPVLRINRTVIDEVYKENFTYCTYTPILRPNPNDRYIEYGNQSAPFDKDVLIPPEHEFLVVVCHNGTNQVFYTNIHGFITIKPDLEKRCNQNFETFAKTNPSTDQFNVLLIGIDSISRLNFHRNMQQTRDFLINELSAIEMFGYNKVADNTFYNMVPLLSGKFAEELPWNSSMMTQEFDIYDFIWKNYSKAGYRTLFAEDAPGMGMFTYSKEGFHNPPTDYYTRPMAFSMSRHVSLWNLDHLCFGDQQETEIYLKITEDFATTFKDKPYFGLTFISRLTHDYDTNARFADFLYAEFLSRIKNLGLLENTVLFLFSDHGPRFGDWRSTYIGKVEERLPFNYLVFPKTFHQKYPRIIETVRNNSKRLTTTFDVHETLNDILNFDVVNKPSSVSSRGISLFREIPKERSCQDAGIPSHWCLCSEETIIDKDSRVSLEISKGVVAHINELLVSSVSCAKLSLESVSEIVKIQPSDKVPRVAGVDSDKDIYTEESAEMYQISLVTSPGHAAFEATVMYNQETSFLRFEGQISRINYYGNQSICEDDVLLKLYCFCNSTRR